MMEAKKPRTRTPKVQGYNIVENECIWMKAGVIDFKLCDQAYDCIHCRFDKAMARAVGKKKVLKVKKQQESWRDRMRRKHAEERECRHMLSGRVQYKICSNDFRCDVCEFDQSLEEIELSGHLAQPAAHRVMGYKVADSYYYHRGHSWARVEHAGRVRLGLDDFALRVVGPVDKFRLPSLGEKLKQSEQCLSLAREGNEAEVLSPVSGTVVALNHKVLQEPQSSNQHPYSDGWLLVVEPDKLKGNLKNLLFGDEADGWIEHETGRLHELIMAEHGPVAATGGEPVSDVFGSAPEVGWKRLVHEFLLT
ncbi:MAG: glycine cleavage system protein H [Syntrophobacteria bacterium]